jgi:hypothetical protein
MHIQCLLRCMHELLTSFTDEELSYEFGEWEREGSAPEVDVRTYGMVCTAFLRSVGNSALRRRYKRGRGRGCMGGHASACYSKVTYRVKRHIASLILYMKRHAY